MASRLPSAAAIADREQLAVWIEQEAELHRHRPSILRRSAMAARRCISNRAALADFPSASISGWTFRRCRPAIAGARAAAVPLRNAPEGQRASASCPSSAAISSPTSVSDECGSPTASASRNPADGSRSWLRAPRPRRRFRRRVGFSAMRARQAPTSRDFRGRSAEHCAMPASVRRRVR